MSLEEKSCPTEIQVKESCDEKIIEQHVQTGEEDCDMSDDVTHESKNNNNKESDEGDSDMSDDVTHESNNNNNKESDENIPAVIENIPPSESLSDDEPLDDEQRNKLFELGTEYEKDGQRDYALKYYLKCLSNLNGNTRFVLLPQCLRNIADIYFEREQYETAIHFVQAEKLYYENALVNNTELQQKIEQIQRSPSAVEQQESDDKLMKSMRADEYEQLSHLCLERNQRQLALEYAGKATKIRQQLYGDEHSITKESLDFFAKVYAEVGKQEYSDSLKDFTDKPVLVENNNVEVVSDTPTLGRQHSILRQRSKSEGDSPKKRVHFKEVNERHVYEREQESEGQTSRRVLGVILVIWSLALTILGLYLYCRFSKSDMCSTIKSDLYYYYMRVKYRYYQYSSSKGKHYG